ncbi:hypothetical protein HL653_19525 [Sphingomonas sp. AP4-R1]|uniref:hypothetical protein n=1 Tax=Sphingomonas sp. AP4-R1 TaxID=2735134 RepID=UPI0014939012|nr:hypothetical protein [Sphingomonas sp. AP4-R1]QJU59652.1 hypothetical protein HL653_19525 [Sphingomonas sp. AP4-R1]
MALTIDDLFASPDHYLHSFDGDAAIFVPMDRAAYHRSIFLDGRIAPAGEGEMRLPIGALPAAPPAPKRTGWIFHIAHCGSTLLARALDRPEANLVLREPLALRQAAVSRHERLIALATSTISKRYDPALPTIVKANVPVNFLLPELAAQDPQAPAILLYLGLDDYLAAILRSDNHRAWLRNVTGQLVAHLGDTSTLSDPERAALLWLAQLRAFASTLDLMPNARSLDAELFFADPTPLLAAAATCLGVPMMADDAAAITRGPLFSTYSKNPTVAFDNDARLARKAELARSIGTELIAAHDWIARNGGDAADVIAKLEGRALL